MVEDYLTANEVILGLHSLQRRRSKGQLNKMCKLHDSLLRTIWLGVGVMDSNSPIFCLSVRPLVASVCPWSLILAFKQTINKFMVQSGSQYNG